MIDSDFDFRRFFDLSPDLLCIAGFDGYFKRVNPAVSQTLGYSEDELYARPIDDFVHRDDIAVTRASREQVIESRTLYHFENRYVTKDGETVWLAWTSQRVPDEELVFAVAKNITHKKRLESERLALLEDLAIVNQELKQFTLTGSHDLRSPLSSLEMVFDMLDESRISDQETLELIELLKATGGTLKKTLNAYVDALSDNMGGIPEPQKVDLEACLNDVLDSIPSLLDTSGASIHRDFSACGSVRFDRTYLESVFMNLITNSIRYARPGVPPVIQIYSEQDADASRLLFEDNGLGIDLKAAGNRMFGINQTFHDREDSKGVGLYLVHSHVTRMGGEIEVESQVGKGTRFIITFPEDREVTSS